VPSTFFETIASAPSRHARENTVSPSPTMCSLSRMPASVSRNSPRRGMGSDVHGELANDAVNPGGNDGATTLDRHQPAKTVAELVDGPNPPRAARNEENYDSEPANGITIDGPELVAVSPRGHVSGRHPPQPQKPQCPSDWPDPRARRLLKFPPAKNATADIAKSRARVRSAQGRRRMRKTHPARGRRDQEMAVVQRSSSAARSASPAHQPSLVSLHLFMPSRRVCR
jgi:hypothetical protein